MSTPSASPGLTGLPIVCFANDWGADPTSKTHIMRILARRNRVLWINSIGMRRPTASGRDLRRIVGKLRQGLAGCREVEPNLFVANPLALPLPGVALADELNAHVLAAWVRCLCRRLGLERPVLWSFPPHVSRLLGRLDERLAIYHCVDEYASFSGVPRDVLIRLEADMVRRADVVLTSSEQLCAERRPLNAHTHFVPHGVDVEHFARALEPSTRIADELRGLPRPIIGFFGQLADWVDLPLVRALADARPAWSFVLVGRSTTDLDVLRGPRNVHLVGLRPYASLPEYCRGFDVGIIPFRTNALTQRANPLKLREYLAAGLPVVSTPLPEVARYDGLVRLAEGRDAYLAQIEAALRETSGEAARRRLDAMRGESWEARVGQIEAIIAPHLERRLVDGVPAAV